MSGWRERKARELLREVDDWRSRRRLRSWLLLGAGAFDTAMLAGWLVTFWIAASSAGKWDAGGIVGGAVVMLVAATITGFAITSHAFGQLMNARWETVLAERAYEDYCLEVADA